MAKNKKKHHYLPQFYVGSFANETGGVFVLDKKTGKINLQGKNGTFHLPYFYTVNFSKHPKRDPESAERMKKLLGIEKVNTNNVKEYPDMIEDLLSESENIAAKVVKRIIKKEKISISDRIELSTFIAFMYARNPIFHDFLNEIEKKMMDESIKKFFSEKEKAKKVYEEMLKEGYDKKIDIEKVFKIVEESRYKIEIPKELTIQNMLMLVPFLDQILYHKTWYVIDAPSDTSFITNDSPVFMDHPIADKLGPFSVGFKTPGVKIIFPISQKCLLVMIDTPRGAIIVRKKEDKIGVRKWNKIIYSHSGNYVIARDEALIIKLKNEPI